MCVYILAAWNNDCRCSHLMRKAFSHICEFIPWKPSHWCISPQGTARNESLPQKQKRNYQLLSPAQREKLLPASKRWLEEKETCKTIIKSELLLSFLIWLWGLFILCFFHFVTEIYDSVPCVFLGFKMNICGEGVSTCFTDTVYISCC